MGPWKAPATVNRPRCNRFLSLPSPAKVLKYAVKTQFADGKLGVKHFQTKSKIDIKRKDEKDSKESIRTKEVEDSKTGIRVKEENRVVVMLSGFTRHGKEEITTKVFALGGRVTIDYREATHLVLQGGSILTKKFFVALSRLQYIVGIEWIMESLAKMEFVDEEKFILKDDVVEMTYNFQLKDLLAKSRRPILFGNVTFFITPSCLPSVPDLQEIIEAAGGQVDKQTQLKAACQQAMKFPGRYVIITCIEDFHLIEEACKQKRGLGIHLHSPDFILESIAQQKFMPLKRLTNTNFVCKSEIL